MTKITINQCLQAQIHLGHLTNEWNPKNSGYILGERNNHHIFDLNQTIFAINRAVKVIKDVSASGGQVLFLGRAPDIILQTMRKSNPYDRLVEASALSCGQPYSIGKWIHGTLTNWNQMIKQLIQKNKKDYLRAEKLNARQMKLYKRSIRKKDRDNFYRPGSVDWPYLKDNFISELNKEIYNRDTDPNSKLTSQVSQTDTSPYLDSNFESLTEKLSGFSLSRTHQLTKRRFLSSNYYFCYRN